jgi:hypothetical protein
LLTVKTIQAGGARSLRAIAAELNVRGIPTFTGLLVLAPSHAPPASAQPRPMSRRLTGPLPLRTGGRASERRASVYRAL